MYFLKIQDIRLDIHRGNSVAKIFLDDEGEEVRIRTAVEKAISLSTSFVLLGGSEPLNQNIRTLAGLCYLLKRKFFKRVIIETEGTRFNQILLANVKHFVVKPNKETFVPSRFQRYVDYGSWKSLHICSTPNLAPIVNKRTLKTYTKYLELDFNVKDSEDMSFYGDILNHYDLRSQEIKCYMWHRANKDYTRHQFTEDWMKYKHLFESYKYFFMME